MTKAAVLNWELVASTCFLCRGGVRTDEKERTARKPCRGSLIFECGGAAAQRTPQDTVLSIMVARLEEINPAGSDSVNEPMFLGDSS